MMIMQTRQRQSRGPKKNHSNIVQGETHKNQSTRSTIITKSRKNTPVKSSLSNSKEKSQSSISKSSKKKSQYAQSANQEERAQFLPGQKYKTPDQDSGALAFYKSLYEQNPNSEMARRYCLEYGVLQYNEAKRTLQDLNKLKPKK